MRVKQIRKRAMYSFYVFETGDNMFDFSEKIEEWSCGLWWSDFEEAGIEECYILFDEKTDMPIGFQTLNVDRQTIAIEIHPEHRGKGLSYLLIEDSGSTTPERDENPSFWESVKQKFC